MIPGEAVNFTFSQQAALNARLQAEYHSIQIPPSLGSKMPALKESKTVDSSGLGLESNEIPESRAIAKLNSTLTQQVQGHQESATALIRLADERKIPRPTW